MTQAFIVEEFKKLERNSLRGFARVRLPSGVIMHDVGIFQDSGKAWASPPSKPQIGRDGTHIKKDGKPAYSPIISFVSKEVRDKFSAAVLDALRASHPEALP